MTTTERHKPLRKNYSIARLNCMIHYGCPCPKKQVNHKDLNKLNNHYTNLEWNTSAENSHHRLRNGGGERKSYQETRRLLDEQQRIFKASAQYLEIMAYLAQ